MNAPSLYGIISVRLIVHITLLMVAIAVGCSDKSVNSTVPGNPTVTAVPGDTLGIGISTRIDQDGNYTLPTATRQIAWDCTGTATIDIQAQSGNSSQQCTDSQQSVTATGPGTVTVQLGTGASIVILASS